MNEPSVEPPAEIEAPLQPHYLCPNCGAAVEASSQSGPVLICPACAAQFFPPAPESADESANEAAEEATPDDGELSAARIRQWSMLTRTAYRTRSYLIVGALACLGTGVKIIFLVIEARTTNRMSLIAIGGLFFAMAAFIGTYKFGARALAIHREIQAHIQARALEELEASKNEPDLSTLSDGSQHARNLEKLAMGEGGREGGMERGREGEKEE